MFGAPAPPTAAGLTDEELKQAFREFDLDKNGYVGAAEIAHILQSMGEKVTDDEVDEMILMADLDGDGQISFEEFVRLIASFSGAAPPAQGRAAQAFAPSAPPMGMPYGVGMTGGGMGMIPSGVAAPMQAMMPQTMGVGAGGGAGMGAVMPMPGSLASYGAPMPGPSGNPIQDMETFQRMHGLDAEALRTIYRKFREADKDKTGMVDINEFCRVLRVERSPFVERLFAMFDTDRGGLIDLKEFVVGLCNVGSDARDNKVRFAFQVFDLDGSGFIDTEEMRKIVKATNMANDKQLDRKVRWLMSQVDHNGDGQISFEEFQDLARRFPNIVFPAYSLANSMANAGMMKYTS